MQPSVTCPEYIFVIGSITFVVLLALVIRLQIIKQRMPVLCHTLAGTSQYRHQLHCGRMSPGYKEYNKCFH
jgi:hypothetical protein